jgi:hypothetical protein
LYTDWFVHLRDFMNGNARQPNSLFPAGSLNNPPQLYCNDDWLLKQDWQDQAFGPTGMPLVDNKQKPVSVLKSFGNKAPRTQATKRAQAPYWVRRSNVYIKDSSYVNDGDQYCAGAAIGRHAATLEDRRLGVPVVTLCPHTFLTTNPPASILRLTDVNPVNGDQIQAAAPVALSLFHE